MSIDKTAAGQWELTDEEWCELCFMVIDMDAAREQLEKALLARERPTLNQLWVAMNAYQQSLGDIHEYVAERLRMKAGVSERQIV